MFIRNPRTGRRRYSPSISRHFCNLNIASIHGFKKGQLRKNPDEIVSTITDPINPARSTLKDGIPSSASLKATITLPEVIKDLKLLNWQKYSITSIKTISCNYSNNNAEDDVPLSEVATKLMYLKGNKRQRSPTPLAIATPSMMTSGSASGGCASSSMAQPIVGVKKKPRSNVRRSNESGSSSGGLSVPDIGVKKRKPGIKRVYLTSLYNSDAAETVAPRSDQCSMKTESCT